MKTFNQFCKDFLYTELENIFFKELENIFKLGLGLTHPSSLQKKIEKLTNLFNIVKKEKEIEINPFWDNNIKRILNKDFSIFLINFDELITKLNFKNNIFDKKTLLFCFTANEVFLIYIISYMYSLAKTEDKLFVKEVTFLSILVDNFYYYLYNKILFILVKKFISKEFNISLDYEEKYNEIIKINRYNNKKKNFNYKDYLILLYTKYNNDGKLNIIEIKKKFLIFVENEKENIKKLLYKFSIIINDFFIDKKLLKKIKGKNGKYTYNYLQFFDIKIFNQIDFILHINSKLPMLSWPVDWNKKGENGGYIYNNMSMDNKLVKNFKGGWNKFEISNYTLDAVNLLMGKIYLINNDFFKYIKTKWFIESMGICSDKEIYEKYYIKYVQIKDEYKKNIDLKNLNNFLDEKLSIQSMNIYQNSTKKEKEKMLKKLYKKYNIKKNKLKIYFSYIEITKILYKEINKLKEYNFILNIINNFKKKNLIWIVSRLDFRGRIYPVGRILHRATGYYKDLLIPLNHHLLQSDPGGAWDINNKYVAVKGFMYNEKSLDILKEYIAFLILDKKENFTRVFLLNYFNQYISINSKIKAKKMYLLINTFIFEKNQDDLIISFNKNEILDDFQKYKKLIIDIIKQSKCKEKLLFAFKEYYGVINNKFYKSNFHIELDQSSSGPQLYALLSHDLEMGYSTNLIKNKDNIKKDIYTDFLNIFLKELKFFKKEYKIRINNNLFTRSEFSKLIIMPKFYNMGDLGLKKLLKSLNLPNKKKFNLESKLIELINKILLSKYNNTLIYQKNLVEIAKILYKNKSSINIKLLDGSFIKYKYIEFKKKYGIIYKNNKASSYRIYLKDNLNNDNLDKKHYSTFPPNFIHSLDGALCRVILVIFNKLYNVILEPLHDSFRIPIVLYYHLQYVIKYVYIYFFFNEFFHRKKLGLKKIFEKENNYYSCIWENKVISEEMESSYIYLLEEESDFYLNYKDYLPDFKGNIFQELIIDQLDVTNDIKELILLKIKELKNENNKFSDEIIKNIIDSEFMFYF